MHLLLASALLALYHTGHAASIVLRDSEVLPVPDCFDKLAPRLPMSSYNTTKFARPLDLFQAVLGENASVTTIHDHVDEIKRLMPELKLPDVQYPNSPRDLADELEHFEKRQATCANPRVRIEWDTYTSADKQAYIDAVKCMMRARPSGRFPGALNRYEDLVVLHQQMTPRVHGNAMFLVWHRYFLWTFEDMLRRECGFTRPLPWFDEARYAGRFQRSSVFSSQWMGTMMARGDCPRRPVCEFSE
jgi:tyrosinase